jgi:hypothetical protein
MPEASDTPVRPPRWDPDERGIGVADARAHLARLDGLRAAADADGWVAEEPEVHLLPHIVRHLADGAPFVLQGTTTDPDGTFVVVLRWTGPVDAGRGTVRTAAYALVGVIAESTTAIIQSDDDQGRQRFEVVTGELADQSRFASHGHTLRLVIDRPSVPGAPAGVDA